MVTPEIAELSQLEARRLGFRGERRSDSHGMTGSCVHSAGTAHSPPTPLEAHASRVASPGALCELRKKVMLRVASVWQSEVDVTRRWGGGVE